MTSAHSLGRPAVSATVTPAVGVSEGGLLTAACVTTTLVPLSSTMVAVALPDLRRDFGLSVATAVWLVSSYLVVTAAAQLVAGGLGDRLGRRRLALAGIAGFGVASLLAAAAPDYPAAVAARCLQAVCGAFALVNAAATVRAALPAHRRGRSFGLIGGAATLAAAAGPPIGGLAVAWAGWRGTFLVVLPLVVVAFGAAVRWLPADPPRVGRDLRFDPLGALLLLCTLAAAAILVNQWADGIGLIPGLALAAWTVAAALAFVLVERSHAAPVLELSVLRVRAMAAAGLAIAASNLAMYLVLLAVPLLVTGGPSRVGVILAPMLFGSAICAPFGGRLADRYGRRLPAVAGNVLLAIAMCGLIPIDLAAQPVPTALLLALAGIGLGVSTAAMQTAGAEALPADQAGVAAGLSSSARYLGSIVGTSLLALLVRGGTGHGVFAVAAVAAIVSMGAALGVASGARVTPLKSG